MIPAKSVEIDEHRWYVIVTITREDDSTETHVIDHGDGSGVIVFDSMDERNEFHR